ncbi:MAG: tetratricopeptide protein [Bacteroidetes bacterium]|nr:tetratricopeptide protein [Bacteroidota bacterium]
MRIAHLIWILPVFASLPGCWTGSQSDRGASGPPSVVVAPTGEGEGERKAMQHFVDGSVHEMKGDLEKAVLEYQDALRYDQDPAIYFAISKCYSRLSKHSRAIEAAREAVNRAPDELIYRRNLADVYALAFEFDAAAQQFEELIKRDSSQVDAWYNLARLNQGRRPLRALEVYEQIIDRFGPEWDVLLQMADLYSKMGKHDRAAWALRQMVQLDPSNKELKKTLAQTYANASAFDSALAVYTELRELHPDDLEIQAECAGVYLARGDYPRAAREFDAILDGDSVSVEVKVRIGELYFQQMGKDSTLAPVTRSIFERVAKGHPDDWRPFWFLGAIGSITRDDSLTVRSFRRVTELASWNPDAWVYLSSVFLGQNNFGEVVRILESAVKVLPDDFRVNFFLGISYSRLNRNIEAARVLERARELNPKEVDAIAQLALVYDAMKRYDDSDALYEEALRLDPANHLVLNNYAYSLAERNLRLERALEMSRKAVEAQPENASYLDTIGWIYFRLGRFTEAETYVKQAISKGEANAVVYEHLGDIYFRLNQTDLAIEHWNMALKLDENNAALRDKIARGSL